MIILITIVHIIVCAFLIIVVLLQSGQSGDVAAAFGGMGSQTAFGPRGSATILSKATTWSAIIFMVTSITLSVYASRRSATGQKSVLQGLAPSQNKTKPATNQPLPQTPPVQPNQPAPAAPAQK
jgi:preprotein translocase subunit SecG